MAWINDIANGENAGSVRNKLNLLIGGLINSETIEKLGLTQENPTVDDALSLLGDRTQGAWIVKLSTETANLYGVENVDEALKIAKEISSSKASSGWAKIDDIIIQWGSVEVAWATPGVSFPVAFPSKCCAVTFTAPSPSLGGVRDITVTEFVTPHNGGSSVYTGTYIAIGY